MTRRAGLNVKKSQSVPVFIDLVAGDLATKDFREDIVSVVRRDRASHQVLFRPSSPLTISHLSVIAAARVVRPGICGRSVMSGYGTTACDALSGINEGVIGFALQQIQSSQAARADVVVVDVRKWPPNRTSGNMKWLPAKVGPVRVVPHTEAADKGMGIVAGATSSRQLLQMNNVSATYYDVFGLQCSDQAFDYVFHELAPALLADAVEALVANVIFVGAFLVRQVTKFHRFDDAVHDHRRTKSGSQP